MDDYNNTPIFSKIVPCCYYILCTLATKHALILQLYTAIGHIAMLISISLHSVLKQCQVNLLKCLMVSIHHSLNNVQGNVKCDKIKSYSRGWFRSIDLWVMGPTRSHCATLLHASGTKIIILLS